MIKRGDLFNRLRKFHRDFNVVRAALLAQSYHRIEFVFEIFRFLAQVFQSIHLVHVDIERVGSLVKGFGRGGQLLLQGFGLSLDGLGDVGPDRLNDNLRHLSEHLLELGRLKDDRADLCVRDGNRLNDLVEVV